MDVIKDVPVMTALGLAGRVLRIVDDKTDADSAFGIGIQAGMALAVLHPELGREWVNATNAEMSSFAATQVEISLDWTKPDYMWQRMEESTDRYIAAVKKLLAKFKEDTSL